MTCAKEHCNCPALNCKFHGDCYPCIMKHKSKDALPFCLFEDSNGDKSLEHFYHKLKERFE